MEERKTVGFRYGVLIGALENQANEQGYTLGDKAETLEKIREAINMCMFHVATDSQTSSMTKNFIIKLLKH